MSGLVLALGMENVLYEDELQHHLYTNHIANAEGQVPECSLCFITLSVDVLSLCCQCLGFVAYALKTCGLGIRLAQL